MIGSLLIGPLKLVFEVIFSVASHILGHPGPAIIVLSLAMNILVLPLYRRADAIQMEARDTENKLKDVVSHIKKTFSGDERMMILQTYYRQNNYNPLSVLSGSLSLLLEIPFFMAAYQFLSQLPALQGKSFGPITDLSAPDGLLVIGGIAINVLPFIMTLVNVISSSLYLKGFPLKTKIQLYGMAAFFLVFLYNSPAGLVFYWTLNNAFSLVKTLFYRLKNPRKVINILAAIAGAGLFAGGFFINGRTTSLVVMGLGAALQLLWLLPILKQRFGGKEPRFKPETPNTRLFIAGGIFLTVLVGILIPSAYIGASPQEYIDMGYFYEPIWYVVQTFCITAGFFLVWFGVFYWLANDKFKVLFSRLVWILSGVTIINYMFFGSELGLVSADLIYEEGFAFAMSEQLVNILVVLLIVLVFGVIAFLFYKKLAPILLVGAIGLSAMSGINISQILTTTAETEKQLENSDAGIPSFTLSKQGKNVVVIMLDRAIGPFIPYILEDKPELKQQLDGFTYYDNTLSFGPFTNFSTPSLYGGYDYTPVKLNQRKTEFLADKHNEALKVVPTLFAQNGFDATIIDPSYAGYVWTPNLGMYDTMDGVTAYHASGKFDHISDRVKAVENRSRNFFFFSMMKVMPVSLQSAVYNSGNYHAIPVDSENAKDVSSKFLKAYNVLTNMSQMTKFSEGNENTYMFLRTNSTHEPQVLQEPDYTVETNIDNSAFYPAEGKTITANGESKLLNNDYIIGHYHSNIASLMRLGEWFDELRAAGVYDNTRIILVSDHGSNLGVFDNTSSIRSTEYYRPLLMVKDFGATGFTTSHEFMTVADTPTLSLDGLVENPVNPFTGNAINSDYKEENDSHHIIVSEQWSVKLNNGKQFFADTWATLKGNEVADKSAWTYHDKKTTLPPDLKK